MKFPRKDRGMQALHIPLRSQIRGAPRGNETRMHLVTLSRFQWGFRYFFFMGKRLLEPGLNEVGGTGVP